MQRLEVSGAVRPIYGSLGFKRLRVTIFVIELLPNRRAQIKINFKTALPSTSRSCQRVFFLQPLQSTFLYTSHRVNSCCKSRPRLFSFDFMTLIILYVEYKQLRATLVGA